jgi:uncharacterized coiled-coil protein SlyX
VTFLCSISIAGLIGDGGQYTLPEGEWFCTECYSTYDSQDTLLRPPSMDQLSVMSGAGTGAGAGGSVGTGAGIALGADVGDGSGRGQLPGSDALYRSLSSADTQALAVESLKIAPNKNPSSVLATIKAEYHTMRKERNRILAQWQQEKRIIEKYEISRRIEQQKKDQELVRAKNTIEQLEDIVTQGEAQSARMQKLFDIMLKELQLSTSNMSNMSTSATAANSAAIRQSADRLNWASLTVESLLDAPVDKELEQGPPSPSRYGLASPRGQAQAGSFTRSPKGLQHSATSPNLQSTHFGLLSSTTPSGGAAAAAGIPKPWKAKPRAVGGGAGAEAAAPSSGGSTPKSVQADAGGAGNVHAPGAAAGATATSRQTKSGAGGAGGATSPHRSGAAAARALTVNTGQTSGGSGAFAAPRSVTGAVSAGNSPMGASSSTANSSGSRATRAAAASTAPTRGDVSPDETERKRRPSDHSDSGSESSRGQSKFINPLKNRLKDLLKSVEAETDAFAEIRQKFKSREEERNQLRHSQTIEK